LFTDDSYHFLPTPVAALPAEKPPSTAASESPLTAETPSEKGVVGNTGGIGAVLRAEPPKGKQVASLRDGQVLEVLGRQDVNGDEWVHVRTSNNVEGWVYGRLVVPAS